MDISSLDSYSTLKYTEMPIKTLKGKNVTFPRSSALALPKVTLRPEILFKLN